MPRGASQITGFPRRGLSAATGVAFRLKFSARAIFLAGSILWKGRRLFEDERMIFFQKTIACGIAFAIFPAPFSIKGADSITCEADN